MSIPTFALALNEDELAILREALGVTSAIKTAQGLTDAAQVLNSLRERTEELPLIQTGSTDTDAVDQHSSHPRSQGGVINQSVSGTVSGGVLQAGDITGGIRF